MRYLKNISFCLVIGIILTLCGYYLKSDFIFEYLQDNIIGLLMTLLAINIATLGLIASKIQDISLAKPGMDFSEPIKEMKISLIEQIVLIVVSVVTLIILDSSVICFELKDQIGQVVLISILIYAIHILWDTGNAVFVIIDEIQKQN